MHKSKLAGFIIDCETDDLNAAADFWSQTLGMQVAAVPAPEGDSYVPLEDLQHKLHIEVQKVSHASRVHLDIETDDLEAEVKRLESLGAKRVRQINSWWVMQAPTGQRFCVVPAQSENFIEQANQWE